MQIHLQRWMERGRAGHRQRFQGMAGVKREGANVADQKRGPVRGSVQRSSRVGWQPAYRARHRNLTSNSWQGCDAKSGKALCQDPLRSRQAAEGYFVESSQLMMNTGRERGALKLVLSQVGRRATILSWRGCRVPGRQGRLCGKSCCRHDGVSTGQKRQALYHSMHSLKREVHCQVEYEDGDVDAGLCIHEYEVKGKGRQRLLRVLRSGPIDDSLYLVAPRDPAQPAEQAAEDESAGAAGMTDAAPAADRRAATDAAASSVPPEANAAAVKLREGLADVAEEPRTLDQRVGEAAELGRAEAAVAPQAGVGSGLPQVPAAAQPDVARDAGIDGPSEWTVKAGAVEAVAANGLPQVPFAAAEGSGLFAVPEPSAAHADEPIHSAVNAADLPFSSAAPATAQQTSETAEGSGQHSKKADTASAIASVSSHAHRKPAGQQAWQQASYIQGPDSGSRAGWSAGPHVGEPLGDTPPHGARGEAAQEARPSPQLRAGEAQKQAFREGGSNGSELGRHHHRAAGSSPGLNLGAGKGLCRWRSPPGLSAGPHQPGDSPLLGRIRDWPFATLLPQPPAPEAAVRPPSPALPDSIQSAPVQHNVATCPPAASWGIKAGYRCWQGGSPAYSATFQQPHAQATRAWTPPQHLPQPITLAAPPGPRLPDAASHSMRIQLLRQKQALADAGRRGSTPPLNQVRSPSGSVKQTPFARRTCGEWQQIDLSTCKMLRLSGDAYCSLGDKRFTGGAGTGVDGGGVFMAGGPGPAAQRAVSQQAAAAAPPPAALRPCGRPAGAGAGRSGEAEGGGCGQAGLGAAGEGGSGAQVRLTSVLWLSARCAEA